MRSLSYSIAASHFLPIQFVHRPALLSSSFSVFPQVLQTLISVVRCSFIISGSNVGKMHNPGFGCFSLTKEKEPFASKYKRFTSPRCRRLKVPYLKKQLKRDVNNTCKIC